MTAISVGGSYLGEGDGAAMLKGEYRSKPGNGGKSWAIAQQLITICGALPGVQEDGGDAERAKTSVSPGPLGPLLRPFLARAVTLNYS